MFKVSSDVEYGRGAINALACRMCTEDGAPAQTLRDDRFRNLLGRERWDGLPVSVQRRFSKPRSSNSATIYTGFVAETRLSKVGRSLAGLARLIGSPLPLAASGVMPAVVSVIDDDAASGQHWTRTYARPGRFPQVVHSSKRFAGPTGLEEYVGYGIGMTLKLHVDAGALVFTSDRYFIGARRWRIYLPPALTPGRMTITHRAENDVWFSFQLVLEHALFGELLFQHAYFTDAGNSGARAD